MEDDENHQKKLRRLTQSQIFKFMEAEDDIDAQEGTQENPQLDSGLTVSNFDFLTLPGPSRPCFQPALCGDGGLSTAEVHHQLSVPHNLQDQLPDLPIPSVVDSQLFLGMTDDSAEERLPLHQAHKKLKMCTAASSTESSGNHSGEIPASDVTLRAVPAVDDNVIPSDNSPASSSLTFFHEFFGEDYMAFEDSDGEESRSEDVPMDFLTMTMANMSVEAEDTDFKQNTNKNAPLYEGASISVWESIISILSFVQCEHLSGVGLGRLLELIHLHLPQPNNFLKSGKRLLNLLGGMDDPVKIHYYCSVCYRFRKSATDLCDKCTDESKSVLFFITFPLLPQLARMLKRPEFVQFLKESRMKENPDNIEDIYDGEIYQRVLTDIVNSILKLTFLWNTDGVQIFNSNNFSLWPFYLVINELPPSIRFLSENLLIAGLWGSVSKPHPNVFLLPIYEELKTLKTGVQLEVYGEENLLTVQAECICGTCDAPARGSFMNMKLHSGFYSCPVCLVRGMKPGDAVVFPFEENIPLRNSVNYEHHKTLAVQQKVIVNKNPQGEELCCGIKGPTLLSHILPDLFDCMAIDSMHCIYLGVMRQLLELWFDKAFKNEKFSVHSKLKFVNEMLRKLTPPDFLQRMPQGIDKLIYWKATELRSFLFNISLPVLKDVLPTVYYDHFALLVKCVALLNSSSVSKDDVILSNLLVTQFVEEFADLYSLNHMTHNLHMLLHLPRCVQLHGPLWVSSCFKFEDINGRLTNFIHGTSHVGLQIHSNLSMITELPLMISNMRESDAKIFCKNLIRKRSRLNVSEKISKGIYCVGNFYSVSAEEMWIFNVLRILELIDESSTVQIFNRLLKDNIQYVSNAYQRSIRVSSYAKYSDDSMLKYGTIEYFVKVSFNSNCYYFAVMKPLVVQPFTTSFVTMNHLLLFNVPPDQTWKNVDCLVPVHNLLKVMFKVQCGNTCYLAEPLNKFEME